MSRAADIIDAMERAGDARGRESGPGAIYCAIITRAMKDHAESARTDANVYPATRWLFEDHGDDDDPGTLRGCLLLSGLSYTVMDVRRAARRMKRDNESAKRGKK